eukprot:sb/3464772/
MSLNCKGAMNRPNQEILVPDWLITSHYVNLVWTLCSRVFLCKYMSCVRLPCSISPSKCHLNRGVTKSGVNKSGSDCNKFGVSKQPIRTRYLGHVTGYYHPIRVQYFLIRLRVFGKREQTKKRGERKKGGRGGIPRKVGNEVTPCQRAQSVSGHLSSQLISVSFWHNKYKLKSVNFYFFTHLKSKYTDNEIKQPIRTRYLGHVTGYQPIRDQYFLIRSVPALEPTLALLRVFGKREQTKKRGERKKGGRGGIPRKVGNEVTPCQRAQSVRCLRYQQERDEGAVGGGEVKHASQEPTDTCKQPIGTRYLGHVSGYQPIRDQYFLIRSVPVGSHAATSYDSVETCPRVGLYPRSQEPTDTCKQPIGTRYLGYVSGYQPIRDQYFLIRLVPVGSHAATSYDSVETIRVETCLRSDKRGSLINTGVWDDLVGNASSTATWRKKE